MTYGCKAYDHRPSWSAPKSAEQLASKDVRVLLAVVAQHSRDGRATVRGVARATDYGLNTTHDSLLWLRDKELVAWEPGSKGTLRPLVTVVPVTRQAVDDEVAGCG